MSQNQEYPSGEALEQGQIHGDQSADNNKRVSVGKAKKFYFIGDSQTWPKSAFPVPKLETF